MTSDSSNRRPIAIRRMALFHRLARWLQVRGVTPNMVSIASVIFSIIGGAALAISSHLETSAAMICYLIAPLMMGLRGTCNLIDGLIAVEGGLKTKSGEVYNDFPDRLSDMALFLGAGYASLEPTWGVPLGWGATCAALMTAYTRVLGGAVGTKQYFDGPMGKPRRMAVLSIACLAVLGERVYVGSTWSLSVGLAVIMLGCIVTVWNRLRLIVGELEK